MNDQELKHYGVPGMKWGHRKSSYITARQSFKNAKAAGKDAWKKTTVENGGRLVGKKQSVALYKNPVAKFKGKHEARTAYATDYKESIKTDKSYNKQKIRSAKQKVENVVQKLKKTKTNGDNNLSTLINNGKRIVNELTKYSEVDGGKSQSKISKREQDILRRQGKKPDEYEKVRTIGGDRIVRKPKKNPPWVKN